MERLEYTWEPGEAHPPRLVSASYWVRPNRYHGKIRCNNPLWVFDYSLKPFGQVRVGGKSSPWRKRGARIGHLYPPRTDYWEDPGPQKTLSSAYCIFQDDSCTVLQDRIPSGFRYARFHDPEGVLEPLLHAMAVSGATRGEAGFWQAQAAFYELIDHLRQAQPVGKEDYRIGADPASGPGDFVHQVDAALDQFIGEKATLASLAESLHVSASTLSHRYSREAGMSPMAALRRRRLERAKSLLLRGLRLDAIAERTGFCDAFHLSKTFKAVFGYAPKTYLAKMRRYQGAGARNGAAGS